MCIQSPWTRSCASTCRCARRVSGLGGATRAHGEPPRGCYRDALAGTDADWRDFRRTLAERPSSSSSAPCSAVRVSDPDFLVATRCNDLCSLCSSGLSATACLCGTCVAPRPRLRKHGQARVSRTPVHGAASHAHTPSAARHEARVAAVRRRPLELRAVRALPRAHPPADDAFALEGVNELGGHAGLDCGVELRHSSLNPRPDENTSCPLGKLCRNS